MEVLVLGYLILRLTDSPFQVGLIGVFLYAPRPVLTLFAGLFADRLDRQRILLVAYIAYFGIAAMILVLLIAGAVQTLYIFMAILLKGSAEALDDPSRRTAMFDLAGPEHLVNAMSLETITQTGFRILGPLTAGLLIAWAGFTGAYTAILALEFIALLWIVRRDLLSCVVAHGVTPLVVRLSQGAVCTGTVRDDADQPLARVVVQCGELATLAHVRTVTAADGTYRLAGLPTGQIALVADGGKRGKESTKIQAAAGETVRWDVRFTSGTKLTGRLLTKRGDPVVGQRVVIVATGGGARMKVLGSVVTDNQGRFSLARCPDRVGTLFRAKGFSPAYRMDVDPGAGEVVLRVEKFVLSVRIKGVVVDPSGKPVAAGVWPMRRGDGNSLRKTNDPGTGAFALGPLPPGVHRLMIEAQGLATYRSADRELAADETWDLGTIQLERGGRAKVVFDRSAVGDVQGLTLGVVDSDLRGLTNRQAGADVAYTEQLPAGHYHVVIRGKDIASLAVPVELKTGEETELTVKLTRGSPFTVRFDTEADRVLVTITGPHGLVQNRWHTRFGEREITTQPNLAPGRYTVTAVTANGAKGKVEFTVSDSEPKTIDLPLR